MDWGILRVSCCTICNINRRSTPIRSSNMEQCYNDYNGVSKKIDRTAERQQHVWCVARTIGSMHPSGAATIISSNRQTQQFNMQHDRGMKVAIVVDLGRRPTVGRDKSGSYIECEQLRVRERTHCVLIVWKSFIVHGECEMSPFTGLPRGRRNRTNT